MNCPFCEIQNNTSTNDNYPVSPRIIFETDNFYVFPTIGSFTEGYLLIASKNHHTSIAQVPEEHFQELNDLRKKTKRILKSVYGPTILFEHGALSRTKRGGCCIEHAHLHLVPTDIEILSFLKKNFSPIPIKRYEEIIKYKTQQYLFIEEPNEQKYIFPLDTVIPSQYIRKIIANNIGKPNEWDWHASPQLETISKTIATLKPLFSSSEP